MQGRFGVAISDPEIRQLEEMGARTWPAGRVEPLGGWLLSFDRGVTRRANSVLPNAWDDVPPIDDRIADVENRYRQAGLAPCFKMTRAALPRGLDGDLHRRGYLAEGQSSVLTAKLGAVEDRPSMPVDLEADQSPDWIACSWPGRPTNSDVDSRCRIAGRTGQPKVFAMVRLDGRPAGAAMAAVVRGWGCITAVRTPPEFRRRGVARALIAALANWAGRQDARSLFLQVEDDNAAARCLYMSAGYHEAYRYHYRTLKRSVLPSQAPYA